VPGFLQRIIRSGTRPVPAAPRPRRQPPTIALEVNHVTEPEPSAKAEPQDAAPAPARSPVPQESVAERQPVSDRTEVRPPRPEPPPRKQENSATTPQPSADLRSGSTAVHAAAIERPGPQAPDDATFMAPRRPTAVRTGTPVPAATPAPAETPAHAETLLPKASIPPANGPRTTKEPTVEGETVFRARPRKIPESASAPGEERPTSAPKKEVATEPAGASQHLQAVVSWIESSVSEEPAARRVDLRAAIAPRPDTPTDAKPDGRDGDGAAGPSPRQPKPAQPNLERAVEAPTQAAPEVRTPAKHETGVRENAAPPAAAERQPAGSRLTVNHLNVQIVNEDRSSRKEPPRTRKLSPPREEWGKFERRHLRVP
jgi:hypothetical protein